MTKVNTLSGFFTYKIRKMVLYSFKANSSSKNINLLFMSNQRMPNYCPNEKKKRKSFRKIDKSSRN